MHGCSRLFCGCCRGVPGHFRGVTDNSGRSRDVLGSITLSGGLRQVGEDGFWNFLGVEEPFYGVPGISRSFPVFRRLPQFPQFSNLSESPLNPMNCNETSLYVLKPCRKIPKTCLVASIPPGTPWNHRTFSKTPCYAYKLTWKTSETSCNAFKFPWYNHESFHNRH